MEQCILYISSKWNATTSKGIKFGNGAWLENPLLMINKYLQYCCYSLQFLKYKKLNFGQINVFTFEYFLTVNKTVVFALKSLFPFYNYI